MSDVDSPLSNVEMRLRFQKIDDGITILTKHVEHTNGSVADAQVQIEELRKTTQIELGKLKSRNVGMNYAYMVFLTFILPTLALTLYQVWNKPQITPYQIKTAVQLGIEAAVINKEK